MRRFGCFYLGLNKGVHFDVASYYTSKKDWENAILHYKKAIVIDPFDTHLYNNLGLIYIEIKQTDQAVTFFENAVRMDENNLMALNNLAIIFFQTDQKENLKKVVFKILTIDPDNKTARSFLKSFQK